jgi:hypothetical protein
LASIHRGTHPWRPSASKVVSKTQHRGQRNNWHHYGVNWRVANRYIGKKLNIPFVYLIFSSELLAPGRPIRALASDGSAAARFKSGGRINRRSCCEACWCCEQLLRCCEEFFPCCEPVCLQHSTKDVAISVASLCVACCEQQGVQHSTSGVFLPSSPPCCDYIATMLRPVLACNIQHQEPSPPPSRHKANIKCLQHHNSTFATLKLMFTTSNIRGWYSFHST